MDGSLDFSVSGDTFPGGRTPAKAPQLKEGDECEARYGGESEWFPGTIKTINADGTYDIDYADGDKETKVIAEFVRVKQPPKTPQIKRQDTEESLKSTQKLKRAASEVEDKERADAQGAKRNLAAAASELDSSVQLDAVKGMRQASDELQERKKIEAQRALEKQARREREKAPAAIKEAAKKVDGEKLASPVADLGRSASKYEAPKEDPHAWMSSSDRRALPDKVEARTWSGLEAKATPELQAALPWDTSDIPTGNRPEVALLAERSLKRSRAPDAISRQQRVLLARSVDFSIPKKKLGPKFATISAHRLSKPIDRSTDVYGRTVKDVTNAAQKRLFKFASRDDALNCTFRPRLGKGELPGEEAKSDGEDNPNNFIQRQDAWGRKVRQDREHRMGEKEYGYVIDKKMCPSCGAVQKYDEIVNKRDRCPECAVAYKSASAIKMARERELLGANDAETCGKCGARQTLEELLDTRDTCAVCAIVYEELVMGGGDDEEEEESDKSEKEDEDLEKHVGKKVKTPSGKIGEISRVEGDLCYVKLEKEEDSAEAKEDDSKKKKGSDDESEAKGSDNGSDNEAKGDDPLANVSPTKSSRRRREKSNLSSDEEDGDDDASDGKGDAEAWVREQWPLMGRKGKETGGAEEGEDEFYFDELQLIEEKKSKKKKKGSDDEYSSDEDQEAKKGSDDDEAKEDGSGSEAGSEAKDDEEGSVKSKKDKKKKKTKKKKRKVAKKRTGPRTLLGRLRADERAQMTIDALLLRERSILQAEAGFLTVELRKLKRRKKLERAATRRATGANTKDAIDAEERAIVKALDDERRAAKASSVYESDPKRREALEAKVEETRATRNAAFKKAVPALKERLDYNQACLDKCRRWRAKLSEKPDAPLDEEEEAKKEDPLMDKLREKGLGTFRERYQRTLEETETPELLDRKLKAIEQYRREMEGQMQRKKVLTQKALRQKSEGKSDDEEDVDPLVAQRVEDELEKLDQHMEELREKIKGVQGEIESRRGDVQQRQEKRYKTYVKEPTKKVYDPETGETTEEPLFNADEGAFDNFIERREATLLKGETLAALELREQSLRRFEADLRKRTARKLRAERKREREEARAAAGSDAEEEEEEDEDELQTAVEDALADKLPDIEQRLADIEQRKEELAELEEEKAAKLKPKAPTKKAFVDGRIKDVPLYNPNKKAYVDPPQSGYLNFMSRQTEVVERATTAQTLKLRETALVRREKEMKKRTTQRRNEVKERERRQELEDERRRRREEREDKEEERKERLLEIHERNKEKREERAERAREARARRREAFLRAADDDDDGASLDAIEQEIETLENALDDLKDEREKVEEDRINAEEDEREAREAASPVKHKSKSKPSEWAEFLGRREEAIERRTTRDSLALREKTLTTYELEITRRKEGKEKEIETRERRRKALEQRRERLEKKREHAEELRDKVLARQEDQMKKRVEKAERRAAAIERRKERDEDYDDDGSLADIKDEIDELDHALEDIREEREKARASRKAKVKEERRIEEEMRRKEKAAQTELADARRRRKEEKKRAERRKRRGRRDDSDSDSGSDRRRRRRDSSRSDSD